MRMLVKLATIGLAGYGGYALWNRSRRAANPEARPLGPTERRINGRAELTTEEWAVGSDNPVAQAIAILRESDERARITRDAPGIERRRSQDTVFDP